MGIRGKNGTQIYAVIALICSTVLFAVLGKNTHLRVTKAFWNTILLDIVRLGDEPGIVKIILSKGADFSTQDNFLDTPLHIAALKGYYGTAKLLILEGADVNARASHNTTPLYCATLPLNEHKEIVELLIKNGADVNAKAYLGETPLHNVASSGSREVAELLILNGADVNAMNIGGFTPLHIAALSNNLEVAEALLLNKANVNAKDSADLTPLKCIKKFQTSNSPRGKALVNLLRKHGAKE